MSGRLLYGLPLHLLVVLPLQVSGVLTGQLSRPVAVSEVAFWFAEALRQKPWRRLSPAFGGWSVSASSDADVSVVTFQLGMMTEGAVYFARDKNTVEARYTVQPISGRGWLIQIVTMLAFSVFGAYWLGHGGLGSALGLFGVFCLLLAGYIALNWPIVYFRWRRRLREALDAAVAVR